MEGFSILERNGRFEMGLKLSVLSGSRPGFLRMGVMAASLKEGTAPKVKEEFKMSVISGVRQGRQVWTRMEGMGSRGQVERLMSEKIFERRNAVMG